MTRAKTTPKPKSIQAAMTADQVRAEIEALVARMNVEPRSLSTTMTVGEHLTLELTLMDSGMEELHFMVLVTDGTDDGTYPIERVWQMARGYQIQACVNDKVLSGTISDFSGYGLGLPRAFNIKLNYQDKPKTDLNRISLTISFIA